MAGNGWQYQQPAWSKYARYKQPWFWVACTAIGLVLYLYRPWGLYFLNDDFVHIPQSAQLILGQNNSIRGGNDFSLYLDTRLFGQQAWGYHLTNLILHIAASLLLVAYVRKMGQLLNPATPGWLPALTGLLFFVYPFHSESVFWILGRTGSLSTLLFLGSLLLYLKAHQGWLTIVGSWLLFFAALTVYESVWIWPAAIAWIIILKSKQQRQGVLQRYWIGAAGFAALFTAFMVYRYQVQQEVLGHYELQPTGQQRQWLLSLAGNYARLLGRSLVMPMQSSLWFTIGSLVAVSVMAYCLLAITLRNKQWYWALFIVSMFGVALLPYITLGIDTHGVESERYLYLPSLYTCMALAYMLVHVKRQALRVGGTLAVLAYFIVALWQSSLRFREASYYVQQTFNYLAQPPAGSTLLFTHLPADCGGAVMLRLGLAEGIQWLHAHKNFKNIWVQNWQEYNQLKIAPVRKLQTGDYGQLKALKVYSALKNDTLMVKVSSDSVWHFEYSIQGLQITTPR